ncbi:MAG: serine protease, partial [Thermoguttaceae bacterium]|nr:serine protease [Thermoguttaceae bacterium]
MNAYLSTTLRGTTAELFGTASASSEWGNDGAAIMGVVAATLVALCVAARALSAGLERRRERERQEARARKRREEEARAAVCNEFWKNNGNSVNYATANDFDGFSDFGDLGDRGDRDGVFGRTAPRERRVVSTKRRNNRRDRCDRRGKKQERLENRCAAARVAAFWTVVALGFLSVLPTLRPTDAPTENERDDATTFATTDGERRWSETNVDFRAVADSEGTCWEGASLLQNAGPTQVGETTGKRWNKQNDQNSENGEKRENKRNGENGENGEKRTVASNPTTTASAADGASLIVERRAVAEGGVADAPKTRWVQTADGKLTEVVEIRAESSIEVPGRGANSLGLVAPQTAETTATSAPWRQRPTERAPQTTPNGQGATVEQTTFAQNEQNSQFARSSQNLPVARRGEVPAFASTARGATTAQNGQAPAFASTAQDASTSRNGQVPAFASTAQDASTARNGQVPAFASTAQDASTARNGQVPAFASTAQGLATARPEQISRFEQTAQVLTEQSGETTRLAQTPSIAQTPQVGRVAQIGTSARNEQSASNGGELQNAEAARRWQNASSRDAVVASVYDEGRGLKAKNALAQEFAPSAPLIPYPSEDRRPSIASVSYEPRPVGSLSLLEQIDAEFQRIGARVRKAVLSIETTKRAPKTKSSKNAVETGSGFLFQYREKIYLATNMHVVKDATSNRNVKIFLPDRTTIHPTKIATCADFDLAALELDPATLPNDGSVALCYFGDSDELQVSNFVGTVGNPFGLRDNVTYGHVS